MMGHVTGWALAALLLALSFSALYQAVSGVLELVAKAIAG